MQTRDTFFLHITMTMLDFSLQPNTPAKELGFLMLFNQLQLAVDLFICRLCSWGGLLKVGRPAWYLSFFLHHFWILISMHEHDQPTPGVQKPLPTNSQPNSC